MSKKTKKTKKSSKETKQKKVKGKKTKKSKSSKNKKRSITKSALYENVAQACGLKRKQISEIFEAIGKEVESALKHNPKTITIPGIVKITVKHKPATKARKGINPFTKEPTVFKAKPARDVVKVRAVSSLKKMVA